MPNRGFLLRCTKPSEYDKNTSSVCKLSTEFVVGRGQESSLFISHPTVSKFHCLFTYNDNGQHWTIEDKSLLGTWVNERRIPKEVEIPLSFADCVRFGPTHKFVYKFRSYLSVGGGSSSGNSDNSSDSDDRMESKEGHRWDVKSSTAGGASSQHASRPQGGSGEAGPSQARQGPSPLKRTLSDRSDPLHGIRPTTTATSPFKRQRQSLSPEDIRQAQLKQIERLEKKQAFLENQLQFQLEDLHKKYDEERKEIVNEQKRLAAELDRIDASHVAEEQELREKNVQKLTSVRQELAEIQDQLSQEGSNKSHPSSSSLPILNTSNNEPAGSSAAPPTSPLMELTQRLQGNCHTEVERALIQRLEEAEREREALLRQLQAARGGANLEDSSARTRPGADARHGCAPGRVVESSSALEEPASDRHMEDDTVTSSSGDAHIPEAIEAGEEASSVQEKEDEEGKVDTEEHQEQDQELNQKAEDETKEDKDKIEEETSEEREKREEKAKEMEQALLKLKNIGVLVEEELQCSICNELLVAAVTINCAHSFCKYCLGEWKKQRAECPMCRMPITAEHRSVTLDSLINTMVGQLSLEIQQRHREVLAERAAYEAEHTVATTSGAGNRPGPAPGHPPAAAQEAINQAGRGPRQQPQYNHHHHHHHHHHNNNNNHHNFNNNNWHAQPPHPQPHMPPGHHAYPHHVHPPQAHPPHAHPPHAHPPHAHAHPPHAHPPHAAHAHPPHAHPPQAHLPHSPPPHAHHLPPHPPHPHQGHAHPGPANPGPGNPGPARHNTPPPGSPPDAPEYHVRVRRRNGRNILSSGSSSGSSSEEPSDSQTSFSSSGGYSTASDRTWFESDYMSAEYDDDENDYDGAAVPGVPGHYYGGYGMCFYCNRRGHWSNGCPVRLGRY